MRLEYAASGKNRCWTRLQLNRYCKHISTNLKQEFMHEQPSVKQERRTTTRASNRRPGRAHFARYSGPCQRICERGRRKRNQKNTVAARQVGVQPFFRE